MDVAELKTTAELARIRLKEGELEKLGDQVDRMLEYFQSMAAFDVRGLEPTTHALIQGNRVRPDTDPAPREAQAMLEQAPDLEGRLIVIPNVL